MSGRRAAMERSEPAWRKQRDAARKGKVRQEPALFNQLEQVMNQAELIEAVASAIGMSKNAVGEVLKAQGLLITAELSAGRKVTLPRIGKLKTQAQPARTGRNPATGEPIEIAARKAVKFTAAKALKDALARRRTAR